MLIPKSCTSRQWKKDRLISTMELSFQSRINRGVRQAVAVPQSCIENGKETGLQINTMQLSFQNRN